MSADISIVVPTYNRPALLKNCLLALLRQQFAPEKYEIIVVTDGPDPLTRSSVAEMGSHAPVAVKCISLPEKSGPAAARNAGWRAASGELILFTDDDCVPDSGWAGAYYEAFKSTDRPLQAFTGQVIVPVSDPPTDFEKNTRHLETAEFITANCAISKAALVQIGGFDEAFTMAWREDSDLHFRLMKSGIPITKIPQAVVEHPVRKATWGVSLREQKKAMFNSLLHKKHPLLYSRKIPSGLLWLFYSMAILFLVTGVLFLTGKTTLGWIGVMIWMAGWVYFLIKRLRGTSKAPVHIWEMAVTSFMIPFLSVYWNLYGAIKFKTIQYENSGG